MTHLRRLILLALLAIICAPMHAQQFKAKEDVPGSILFKDSEENIRARFRWFKQQRAWPEADIPEGAQQRAWEAVQNMNVLQPTIPLSKKHALGKEAAASLASWTLVGPLNAGGRVTGVAIHPTNPDIVYFTAADGGVWKSTNAGANFTPISENLATMAMGSIEIDPINPNIVYVGTGEANGSADSYAGIGVIKSTDAGATWSAPMCTSARNIAKMRVHRTNDSIVLCASRQGIYRTTNMGATWARTLTGLAFDLVLHPTSHDVMFAAVQASGIYKSTDAGATWSPLTIGIAADSLGRIAMDICRSQPNTLYAVIVSGKGTSNMKAVIKTTDGGTTWSRISNASTPNFFSTYGWYNCELAVDPQNPNIVSIGGVSLYRSTTGGATWNGVAAVHADQHAYAYSLSSPSIVYLGNDGGMYRSADAGINFTSLIANMPITQFYELGVSALTPARMIGGTQDNGTWDRSAGTNNWVKATGGDGFYGVFDPTNDSIIYTESQNGFHYRSTNGGKTYTQINTGLWGSGLWNTPMAVHPTSTNIVFTATTKQLYKSTNRGTQWLPFHGNMDSASSINYIAIAPRTPSVMLVGYSNGKVWKTINAGATWTNISTGLPARTCMDIQFHPTDDSTLYASFSGYATPNIFKTTNGGTTWTGMSSTMPALPVSAIQINPWNPLNVFAGTDLGVYTTTDGGTTWSLLSTGMPKVVVTDLELQASTGILYAATHGRSVYSLTVTTPVEFTSFAGEQHGHSVVLSWRTSWEAGNLGYAVQRYSTSLARWEDIGWVAGHGSTGSVNLYSFADDALPTGAGQVTYRLRQMDFDGSYTYSHEVTVNIAGVPVNALVLEQNYPNPFNPATTIRWHMPAAGRVRLAVTDARGREVAVLVDDYRTPGSYADSFDASGLAGGVYFYHLTTEGGHLTRSMMLLK